MDPQTRTQLYEELSTLTRSQWMELRMRLTNQATRHLSDLSTAPAQVAAELIGLMERTRDLEETVSSFLEGVRGAPADTRPAGDSPSAALIEAQQLAALILDDADWDSPSARQASQRERERRYQSDSERAESLKTIIAALSQNFRQKGYNPRDDLQAVKEYRRKLIAGKVGSSVLITRLRSLWRRARGVARYIERIPSGVIAFARDNGLFLHGAVVEGHALRTIALSEDGLKRMRVPDAYAFENLERIFHAVVELHEHPVESFATGYPANGAGLILPDDPVLAVGIHLPDKTNQIFLYKPPYDQDHAGVLVGPAGIFRDLRTTTGASWERTTTASIGATVATWNPERSVPYCLWELPNQQETVISWSLSSRTQSVYVASSRGTLYRATGMQPLQLVPWLPEGDIRLVFHSFGRPRTLVEDAEGRLSLFALDDGTLLAGPVFVTELPEGISDTQRLHRQNRDARFQSGTDGGVLLLRYAMEMSGEAVLFLCPATLKPIRSPVYTTDHRLDYLLLAQWNGADLLIATLMGGQRGRLACWELSPDTTKPATLHGPYAPGESGGWALGSVSTETALDVLFTVRPIDMDTRWVYELWKWRWPDGQVTRLGELPEGGVEQVCVL